MERKKKNERVFSNAKHKQTHNIRLVGYANVMVRSPRKNGYSVDRISGFSSPTKCHLSRKCEEKESDLQSQAWELCVYVPLFTLRERSEMNPTSRVFQDGVS